MRFSTSIFPLLLTVCLFVTSCGEKKAPVAANRPPGRNAPTPVNGYIVSEKTITESATVPGSLLPYEETELHPEISGRVVQLNIREGANVGKGALLIKLFDGDLQAQLKKLEVQLATAEKTVERYSELLKISGISQQEVDLSILSVNTIKADIAIIKTDISRTELRAPFSGRLGLRSISQGAYVTPTTVITTIREVNQLKLEFTIPEKYSSRIKTGMQVNFKVEGSSKKYLAKVIATESSVTEASRSLRVRCVVTNGDAKLIPGTFAEVNLSFGESEAALMVPSQAVLPQARDKKIIVYRDSIAKFEKVTTGMRDSSKVQITSGLKVGDTIIISGLLTLKPDGKVKLVKIEKE
ncbi:MAG: efflux RND transporter periplasmic adaptor subunit [Gemmatimonadaceae bacterium]|nr:efflux RND transporter periplasmic adaptor subunit [Chitinophagaceae bacterium]